MPTMLEKATWLMERLRTPVTMRKLQEEWMYDPMNNYPGRPFDKKTFENWSNYLAAFFGVEVENTLLPKVSSGSRQRKKMAHQHRLCPEYSERESYHKAQDTA